MVEMLTIASAVCDLGACERGDQQKPCLHVSGCDGVDFGLCDFGCGSLGEDSGVVDENVDAAAAQFDGASTSPQSLTTPPDVALIDRVMTDSLHGFVRAYGRRD